MKGISETNDEGTITDEQQQTTSLTEKVKMITEDIENHARSEVMVKERDEDNNREAKMDIGRLADETKGPSKTNSMLEPDRALVLEEIYEQVGSRQVSRCKLEFAPSWIFDESFKKEHDDNGADAYEVVSDKSVPSDANVVGSHTVYKVRTDEE